MGATGRTDERSGETRATEEFRSVRFPLAGLFAISASGQRADDEEGSAPIATALGSGVSGGSCEKSSSQAKNRTNARR